MICPKYRRKTLKSYQGIVNKWITLNSCGEKIKNRTL